ncbi:MAG: 4Fe-4S binding protein [Desulfobulbaceae bacterium]|nr:4Fe-4S binding protein [Desulfobulbaceae bacterium]
MTLKKHEGQREELGEKVKKQGEKLFEVVFSLDWCKSCGICIAFCPKKIIIGDKVGKPRINDSDSCIGCRFCEIHCPDFAITVQKRFPKRRQSDVP